MRFLSSGITFFFLLIGIGCFGQSESLPKELKNKIRQGMEDGDIPGIAVAVIEKGKDPVFLTLGKRSVESNKNITPYTRFEIGSCSKSFTALALLKLEKEGKVDLNDPVSKYLPWFKVQYKGKQQAITLNQLLHHTSGIPFKTISKIQPLQGEDALEKTVRTLRNIELSSPPGSNYEYATINYDVIGLIIEKVSNLSYEEFMRTEVFHFLELRNTTVGWGKAEKSCCRA